MEITTVKIQENAYLVNNIKLVPFSEGNTEYRAIKNWELGKTQDWLMLEETFNTETANHDNWLKIQSYESDVTQYNIDMTEYNNWVWSESTPIKPNLPEFIQRPNGYWSADEASDSVTEYYEWRIGYDSWVADTDSLKPESYWVTEPKIKLVPGDIVEPTVTPLPTLVPNVPEPNFTLNEIKENKKNEIKRKCNIDIENNFTSNALGMDYEYESTLKDQINISGAAQANTTVDFTVIDAIGNKLRVSHSATQMKQVFADGVTVMQAKKNALYILLGQVNAASDEATVNSIVWS